RLRFAPSTIERIGSSKISQSKVDWVISSAGQLVGQPNPKKPTALRGVVGVWDCESSDYIRGRDGACLHAVGFLVGASGYSISFYPAFSFLRIAFPRSVVFYLCITSSLGVTFSLSIGGHDV